MRGFINARSTREIIFVRGTTEAINLVAQSYARPRLRPGDEILITALEHHANIVPWQLVCEQTGAQLKVVPIIARPAKSTSKRSSALIGPRTRLVALAHVSNALGTILPVERFIARAKRAQGARAGRRRAGRAAQRVDVQALDCDFYCFSAHKMYGPTGIGVLYGRESLLEAMPPWQGGGDMILTVTFEGRRTTSCRASSRPARRTSPAPSAWPPRSTISRASAWSASPRTSTSCSTTRRSG